MLMNVANSQIITSVMIYNEIFIEIFAMLQQS